MSNIPSSQTFKREIQLEINEIFSKIKFKLTVGENGAFKIAMNLDSKSVHPSDETINEATLERINQELYNLFTQGRNEREKVLQALSDEDPNQIKMDFFQGVDKSVTTNSNNKVRAIGFNND